MAGKGPPEIVINKFLAYSVQVRAWYLNLITCVKKNICISSLPHVFTCTVDLSWIAGWMTSRHIRRGHQVPSSGDDGGLALW